jgi:DNA replication protein DnaC
VSRRDQVATAPRVDPCLVCGQPVGPRGYLCELHQVEEDARAQRRREEEAERNRRPWLEEIGVPLPLHAFTFETLEATRAVTIMKDFWHVVEQGRALVMLGPTGVGKTVAASALINALLPSFRTSMCYVLGLTLVRQLHAFDECDDAMERCTRTRLLVLDDLPRVGDERVAQMLEELLIVREAERRATVITSNVPPKQIGTLFTDRVLDRLKTWGSIQAVTGESLRRAPATTS